MPNLWSWPCSGVAVNLDKWGKNTREVSLLQPRDSSIFRQQPRFSDITTQCCLCVSTFVITPYLRPIIIAYMDPVTALGVAAATVQFISFAGDVISKSRELYLSADGTLVTQTELDTIAKSLVRLCAPIKHWDPARGKRWRLNSTELELKGICQGCVREAESLQRGIEKLKIQGSHHRKWKSFRQALNSINSEREIEQLSTRLDRYRAQLDTTLLFILRSVTLMIPVAISHSYPFIL
jgi:hypothetical protein